MNGDASAGFNEGRRELMGAENELAAELSGTVDPIERNEEEKGISIRALAEQLRVASDESADAYGKLRDRWFERLLGPEREAVPASYHMAYMRRLSPLEETYTKERSVEVCMETLSRLGFDLANEASIRLDLDDRPQKSPRACVIASDAPEVVHLITRAQGGLHDYQAFLHEAGHALHYAGCDPDLPYTFRNLSRDHALTEIYSFILEAISREPGWHAEHFDLSDEEAATNAEATTFLDALLYRRYAAKLGFELEFWGRFDEDGGTPDGYSERLGEATGVRYRPDAYLADMDAGFYSADYLRAWIRSAQLRAAPGVRGWARVVALTGDRQAAARALQRRDAPVERGDRRSHRLRSARHRTARLRAFGVESADACGCLRPVLSVRRADDDPPGPGPRSGRTSTGSSRSAAPSRTGTSGSRRSRTSSRAPTSTSPPS